MFYYTSLLGTYAVVMTGKSYLHANGVLIRASDDPIATLLDTVGCITEAMAVAWFRHAGYMFGNE